MKLFLLVLLMVDNTAFLHIIRPYWSEHECKEALLAYLTPEMESGLGREGKQLACAKIKLPKRDLPNIVEPTNDPRKLMSFDTFD